MTLQCFQKAEHAAWVSIAGNVGLALFKGAVGYAANSKALLADALHSASSAASTFAALTGHQMSNPPTLEGEVYRRSRALPAAPVIAAAILLLLAIETGLSSAKSIYTGAEERPETFALIAIIFAIIVKEAFYQYRVRLGKQLGSQLLMTQAWERRSDVYSSVVALVGVGGAAASSYTNNEMLAYLDPTAGLVLSVMALKKGYELVTRSLHHPDDRELHQENAAELLETVQRIKGVISVDDLKAVERGHYVIVDVKISVNPRISVMEGYDIAKTVKQILMKRFIHVSDVFVQVNPYDPGYPYKNTVDPEHDNFPSLLH
jgi:cation diffusion facilitator family transporter